MKKTRMKKKKNEKKEKKNRLSNEQQNASRYAGQRRPRTRNTQWLAQYGLTGSFLGAVRKAQTWHAEKKRRRKLSMTSQENPLHMVPR
jgi:hypothetical protein